MIQVRQLAQIVLLMVVLLPAAMASDFIPTPEILPDPSSATVSGLGSDEAAGVQGESAEKFQRWLMIFQIISNIFVLIAALGVLAAGVTMSWLLFRKAPEEDQPYSELSRLKISRSDGIEINPPFMGLVVFVLSLLFFYFVMTDFFSLELVGVSRGQ